MLALMCMCLESRDNTYIKKLSGASTFHLFGQDAKIWLAQVILGNDSSGSVKELW